MANLNKAIEQQQGYAAPDNIYSTIVHELFHWKDANEYRKIGKVIDRADDDSEYSKARRTVAEKELIKAGVDLKDLSNILSISYYAYRKILANDFDEVYTEYRTKKLLEG